MSTSKPWQTPKVIFNPEVYLGMQRGINQLANVIRPTLGPLPRLVAHTNFSLDRPESLDCGALIARRIIQLPDRQADVGAMYLRNLLWRLYETVGDGTATATVLFQAIYNAGVRYLSAGGDPMRLRRYLEQGQQLIATQLHQQTRQISGQSQIAGLAESICYDQDLSRHLGEIFTIMGPYGRLEVRLGHGPTIEHQYTEGSYWDAALLSPHMVTDQLHRRALLENAAILLSDLDIQEPAQLLPAMQAALTFGASTLMLIARSISDAATSVVLMPANRERLLVAAAKTPGADLTSIRESLQDMALLTGATALLQDAGDRLEHMRPEQLGHARRIWADPAFVCLVGGRGDPALLRNHVAKLRAAYSSASDASDRQRLLARIGRLLGGTATLWTGGISPIAIEQRKALAIRTAEAIRGALREGVLPGAGVALLGCIPMLHTQLRQAQNSDERAAYQILAQACEAPARALYQNAGLDQHTIMATVRQSGYGYGFDIVRQELCDVADAGILDSAAVLGAALHAAVHSAALALTIDVLVHRANPPDSSTKP